jgi:PAS domain S-box-containing protein
MSSVAPEDATAAAGNSRPPGPWSRLATSVIAPWAGYALLLSAFSLGWVGVEAWSGNLIVGAPLNAVGLTCLLRSRTSRWGGIVALFVLNCLGVIAAHGKPLPIAASIALVNGVQVLACAAVLRRLLGPQMDLSRFRDLAVFSLAAGLIMPLLSVSLVSLAQPQVHSLSESLPTLFDWAVGAALSYLLVTPTAIACAPAKIRMLMRNIGVRRIALVLAAYIAAVLLISVQKSGEFRLLLVPALLWLTFQLGSAGATLGLVIQAVTLSACVVAGVGPAILGGSAAAVLAKLQFGLALKAVCAYPIAAALSHRWRLGQSLAQSNASLQHAQNLTRIAEQLGGVGWSRYDLASGERIHSENLNRMIGGAREFSVHPEDVERVRRQGAEATVTGQDYETTARVRAAEGGWRVLRSRTTCEKGPAGQVTALVTVVIDVTDMQLADQALRASEARYRLLAENSNDMIIMTDCAGELIYASPSVSGTIGLSAEDLGPHCMHPEDLARAQALKAEMLRNTSQHEDGEFTFRMRHRDGRWIWLEMRSAPIRDPESGEVTGKMHVARDVTERKAMEAELQRKCDEAEAANRAKSEFLANMSHEIRTPLNGVMGVAGALARTELSGAQQEMVALIETSAKTLETLLSDILDLARIEAGKLEIKPEPFDLAASVNACGALFDAAAQAKGLDLEVAIAPGALGAYVGDPARIRQILSNLLGNAVKFTQVGGVKLTVGARRGETSSQLVFEVRDSGIGFDAETKARLFSRFEQADGSITRRFGGSGLGLAISRSLAEAMGGRLEADAEPGEGAVFTLTLELPRCEGAFDLWGEPAETNEPAPDPLAGMRVLLAEDHPTNRRVVELILGAAGVELTCVENGVEAVDAFRRRPFDLILMDMQMPLMDGLSAIEEIRRLEALSGARPTPIHVLTANAMPEHIAASLAAGADGHLAKPILADALLERVAEAAGARCELSSAAPRRGSRGRRGRG